MIGKIRRTAVLAISCLLVVSSLGACSGDDPKTKSNQELDDPVSDGGS